MAGVTNVTDDAFDRLHAIEAEITAALASQPNEADTRFKALDRILLDVLGWQHDNVLTEPLPGSGFIDYAEMRLQVLAMLKFRSRNNHWVRATADRILFVIN